MSPAIFLTFCRVPLMEWDWNSVFEGGGDDESGKYANARQQHRGHSLRFTILPYPATSQGLHTISEPNDTTLLACLTGKVKRHIHPKSKSGTRQRWPLEIVYSVMQQKKLPFFNLLTHTADTQNDLKAAYL